MPMLMLCLLCALAMVAQPAPVAPMSGSEPAQQEELTLLFHGALQLSQALNGVYRATEAQLTEAGRSLSFYGQALGLLGQEVSHGQDAAQELRASLLEMQMAEDGLKLQAEATAQALGEVAEGQQVLWKKMKRMEVQLRGAWLGHARQEFEALKVRGSQPWGSQDPDSQPDLISEPFVPETPQRPAFQHPGLYSVCLWAKPMSLPMPQFPYLQIRATTDFSKQSQGLSADKILSMGWHMGVTQ
ncbi:angiopoietin-like protein 8 isoform X1 [Neophocaena asiaeorientalis asiaeorientalis]|uniref:Angiopoietin-like protein 8 isoform X1 n=1 Tax=Neophocaena asiaeorientalis asiaeorientalis TaxID=1706337 RepID=A0A341BIH3_NEOAA|nr:angiopoietin-like protein 8 isoform X1 [Neophocaena asiaeorientalis asiaeorientalis]